MLNMELTSVICHRHYYLMTNSICWRIQRKAYCWAALSLLV